MENLLTFENRITDEIKNRIRIDVIDSCSIGVPWDMAVQAALAVIRTEYNIEGDFTSQEHGKIGGTLKYTKPIADKKWDQFNTRVLMKGIKECSKCKKIKPFNDFNNHSYTKDGLQYWCRDCQTEDRRKSAELTNAMNTLFSNSKVTLRKFSIVWEQNRVRLEYKDGELLYEFLDDNNITKADIEDAVALTKQAETDLSKLS